MTPPPEPGWDYLPRWQAPFNWSAFLQKYRLLLQDQGRPISVLGQMAGRMALLAVNQASWLADALIEPDWHRYQSSPQTPPPSSSPQAVGGELGPIFIIGHQRSGTTLMHRLLASDRTHARALTFQEMLFPAISFQHTLAMIARADKKRGGKLAAWFQRRQDALFGPMDPIHRIRFDEIEEDEFILWSIFESAMCANDAPASVAQPALDDLRNFDAWPIERQQRALGWYRACLLKKIYREPAPAGEMVWIVGKNPAFSQKIPQLLKVFPDAKFIHLVRNPLETIPSRLSLIRAIWRQRFSPDIEMTPAQVDVIVQDSLRTYTRAHRDLADVPAESQITIRYEEFLSNVGESIREIYAHFNLPNPDASLESTLATQVSKSPQRSATHEYSLAEFGLNESDIREALKDSVEF